MTTCARQEVICLENTQRITNVNEASNKIFFLLLKTSYFNGSCNVTLTFYDVTLTYTEMVSAVTCAVKMNRWQEQFLIGSRHMPPFFRRCGHLRTPTQVSEEFKTPIINTEQYYSSTCGVLSCKMEIKSKLPTNSVVGGQKSRQANGL